MDKKPSNKQDSIPFIRVPADLYGYLCSGILDPLSFTMLVVMRAEADFTTGIWRGCAERFRNVIGIGEEYAERAVQSRLSYLHRCGFLTNTRKPGQRGYRAIELNNFVPTKGESKGILLRQTEIKTDVEKTWTEEYKAAHKKARRPKDPARDAARECGDTSHPCSDPARTPHETPLVNAGNQDVVKMYQDNQDKNLKNSQDGKNSGKQSEIKQPSEEPITCSNPECSVKTSKTTPLGNAVTLSSVQKESPTELAAVIAPLFPKTSLEDWAAHLDRLLSTYGSAALKRSLQSSSASNKNLAAREVAGFLQAIESGLRYETQREQAARRGVA